MSLRNWKALIFDNLSIFFFNLCLLIVRIWSTAIAAFLFAHLVWSRVLHCGCTFEVMGQQTPHHERYLGAEPIAHSAADQHGDDAGQETKAPDPSDLNRFKPKLCAFSSNRVGMDIIEKATTMM